MTKPWPEPKYVMQTYLTDGRKNAPLKFFTFKSARHHAKALCNSDNVEKIVLKGGGQSFVLYEKDKEPV